MKVVIIDYGAGNVFSVTTALQRLGVQAVLSSDVRLIVRADRVIFPGVGQAAAAMEVKKFADSCKVPHMGWNTVRKLKTTLFQGINPGEWMYFVHSYYVPVTAYCIATCDYQRSFAAAICKNNFYGCQFHPEKSAGAGEKIIKNFLDNYTCNRYYRWEMCPFDSRKLWTV